MQATKEQITEESFLGAIYKNTKMGADAIIDLLPRVKSNAMRSAMTIQLNGYERYAASAAKALQERGVTPKEENIVVRMGAKMGMAFSTMLSVTTSHIAELMIEGSNMGITDMIKLLNNYKTEDSEAVRLAREVVAFEEHNIETMKDFL